MLPTEASLTGRVPSSRTQVPAIPSPRDLERATCQVAFSLAAVIPAGVALPIRFNADFGLAADGLKEFPLPSNQLRDNDMLQG